jgi:diguanylate cyclase (GGDEF)-like protein/PAS domain S-box-containing protein
MIASSLQDDRPAMETGASARTAPPGLARPSSGTLAIASATAGAILLLVAAAGIGALASACAPDPGSALASSGAHFRRNIIAVAVANAVALALACAGVFAILRHRTERSVASRLAEQTARLRALRLLDDIASSSTDSIYARDGNGRFIFANRQVCETLQMSAEEVVGRSVDSLFPPEQAETMRESDLEVMRDGGSVTSEMILSTPHGDRDFAFTKSVLRDSLGTCIGTCAVGRDVTDRKREDATRRQWAMAFESTRDGVMITDTVGRILAVNRAVTLITGYSEGQLIGRTPRILQSGRHGAEFYKAMWATLGRTGHWQGEVWNRRSDGEVFPQLLSVSAVRDSNGALINYVSVATDVTPLKRSEARLYQLAHYDPLTNLPNRHSIQHAVEEAIARSGRTGLQMAVLYIDLDGFKTVNDSLGHPAGDELLMAVANRLSLRLRDTDKLGRLGGDEFLVLLENLHDGAEAAVVARDLLSALAAPIPLVCGRVAYVTGSLGISVLAQERPVSAVEMMRDADTAMYRAKERGRNQFCFYTADLNAMAVARLETEGALCQALARDELLLHYQPKIEGATGRVAGVEALLRWQRGDKLVPPGQFIAIAEQSSLILDIGAWVIDQACAQARAWLDSGAQPPRIAVNVAARQFAAGDLDVVLTKALARHGVPASCLEVELTESMLMDRPDKTAPMLHRIRELGVVLSLDDFGTGYSNLGYLQQFPLDFLKIDQSFVRAMGREPDGTVIVDAVIDLAHRLGLKVIAEGVETTAQRDYLVSRGCDELQGYLFSRPLRADALGTWLSEYAAV